MQEAMQQQLVLAWAPVELSTVHSNPQRHSAERRKVRERSEARDARRGGTTFRRRVASPAVLETSMAAD